MAELDRAASAEDRSRFFWWLASWFLAPPDAEQLAGLPSPAEAAPPEDELDRAWLALALARPDPSTVSVEEVGGEFTRLLGGIQEGLGPPPPFESVWREERLMGEATTAVIQAYAGAGFADLAPEAGPQDHLAAELRFIALLALREAEAWRAGDPTSARLRLAQQREFLERHPAAWAPRWADTLIRETRLPLFAALAGLIKAGLAQAARELAEAARPGG